MVHSRDCAPGRATTLGVTRPKGEGGRLKGGGWGVKRLTGPSACGGEEGARVPAFYTLGFPNPGYN